MFGLIDVIQSHANFVSESNYGTAQEKQEAWQIFLHWSVLWVSSGIELRGSMLEPAAIGYKVRQHIGGF
ncbi:MAG: hypothetical protein AAFR90_13195 [Pseudomonadota bacterium]